MMFVSCRLPSGLAALIPTRSGLPALVLRVGLPTRISVRQGELPVWVLLQVALPARVAARPRELLLIIPIQFS